MMLPRELARYTSALAYVRADVSRASLLRQRLRVAIFDDDDDEPSSFFSFPANPLKPKTGFATMKAMEVPVYRPTLKEMEAGLEAYVHRIEREGGRFATAGLAKIVPPAGWTPRRAGYNNRWDVTIDRPIK